jgi:hypothetical protein
MSHWIRQAFIVLLATAPAFSPAADTLVLHDGRRLSGEVSRRDDGGYVLKTKAGSITFLPGDVADWQKDAATTGPASQPTENASLRLEPAIVIPKSDPAVVTATATHLIGQGINAMHAGDARAALENFADARQLFDGQRIRIDPKDPLHFLMLQGMGTAYMMLSHFEKANEPLDLACASPLRDRSVVMNRVILEIAQHVNAMHAVKEMMDYLSVPEKQNDELALNLLGTALGYLAQDYQKAKVPLFQKAAQLYESRNSALESRHRGKKHWGVEWLSDRDAYPKEQALKDGKYAYKKAVEEQDAAANELKAAEEDYENGRTGTLLKKNPTYDQQKAMSHAIDRLNKAKDRYANSVAATPKAWKAIPWPQWPDHFPPLAPDYRKQIARIAADRPVVVARTPPPSPPLIPVPSAANAKPEPATPVQPPSPPPTVAQVTAPPAKANNERASISRSAVAVPVGPDLLITAAAPLANASEFLLERSSGESFKAELVRADPVSGLALLRVAGQRMPYLNLAAGFTAGDVVCWGFPDVSVFSPVASSFGGSAGAAQGSKWTIAMRRHPRLAGTALVDKSGALVGIGLGDRETVASQIPAATLDQIRAFLGADAPKAICSNPDPGGIMQLTASRGAP